MEAEPIGLDDNIPQILWTKYFMEYHGHTLEKNIVFQNNNSAITVEKNGKASSSKSTKNVKGKIFFIEDKVDQREFKILSNLTNVVRCINQTTAMATV